MVSKNEEYFQQCTDFPSSSDESMQISAPCNEEVNAEQEVEGTSDGGNSLQFSFFCDQECPRTRSPNTVLRMKFPKRRGRTRIHDWLRRTAFDIAAAPAYNPLLEEGFGTETRTSRDLVKRLRSLLNEGLAIVETTIFEFDRMETNCVAPPDQPLILPIRR
jgi:hypothetical protein